VNELFITTTLRTVFGITKISALNLKNILINVDFDLFLTKFISLIKEEMKITISKLNSEFLALNKNQLLTLKSLNKPFLKLYSIIR
jgi:hypothetical protein